MGIEMEIIKQPWLKEDEIFEGKPRHFHVDLINRENLQHGLRCDRQNYSKSTLSTEGSSEANVGDKLDYFDTSKDGEVSFLLKSPVVEFNWLKYTKDLLRSGETEMLLDILGDLNSHTLVLLGNDQLKQDEAEKHLKVYREYLKEKEMRIKADTLKKLEKSQRQAKKQLVYERVPKKGSTNPTKIENGKKAKKQTSRGVASNSRAKIDKSSNSSTDSSENLPLCDGRKNSDTTLENEATAIKESDPNGHCPICQEIEIDVTDHLLRAHFRLKILNDYPSTQFKCFFKECSYVTIPASASYIRHIGVDHKILEKLIAKEKADKVLAQITENAAMFSSPTRRARLRTSSTPARIDNGKESASSVSTPLKKTQSVTKKTPKSAPGLPRCPVCKAKNVTTNPELHLSNHYVSKVKADFPLFREDGGYICPIVDCPTKEEKSSGLIYHLNIDHEQINIYLSEDGHEPLANLVKKKRGRKRKLSAANGNTENVTPTKKCNLES